MKHGGLTSSGIFRLDMVSDVKTWEWTGRTSSVLSTAGDTPSEAFACGEALSRVLLECTMTGLATCPLTHLIELEESRDIVRGLINRQGMPQVLIRVGIAPPMENLPAATPHRPYSTTCSTSAYNKNPGRRVPPGQDERRYSHARSAPIVTTMNIVEPITILSASECWDLLSLGVKGVS